MKTRIDLEVKEIRERRDTVSVLKILEDMSKTSREKIEKYCMERPEGEAGATTLEEVRIMGDWLYNSSKSMTSCGRVELSLAGHSCLAPYYDLVHVRPCRMQLGAATDRRCERQLESAISQTLIAASSEISTNSIVLDSARIVKSVA